MNEKRQEEMQEMERRDLEHLERAATIPFKRWAKIALATLCVCLMAFAVGPLFFEKPTPARNLQTEQSLRLAYHQMLLLQERRRMNIVEQLNELPKSDKLLAQWRALLVSNATQESLTLEIIDRQLCRDAYGRPFNMEFKSLLSEEPLGGDLIRNPFQLIIWSAGSNGINEWGKGDDVYLKEEDINSIFLKNGN